MKHKYPGLHLFKSSATWLIWGCLCMGMNLARAQSAGNTNNLSRADSLLTLANDALKTRPEDGIIWLKEAQFIYKNQERRNKEIDCILSLAEIHLRLSDFEISYSLLTNAASMSLEYNLPHQHLMSLGSLGRVSVYMEETERAISFFNDGIELSRQKGYRNELQYFTSINAHTKIVYLKDYNQRNFNDIETAYNFFFRNAPNDTLALMPVCNFYANALFYIRHEANAAKQFYQKAIELADRTGDKYRSCLYANNFATMLRETGELQRAKEIFQESLRKGTEINSKLLLYTSFRNLSLCAEQEKNFEQALNFYKKYEVLKNQVLNENLIRKTRQIHSLYQLEKKGRENDKIKSEQALSRQQSESEIKSYQIFSFLVFIVLVFFLILFYINRTRLNESIVQSTVINEQNAKLQELNADLWKQRKAAEDARLEAEKAIRSKIDFFSIVTHEIRTPLNAVIGMVQLLEDENPNPHQVKSLNLLRFSAENLLNLVNDILDFNKIEAQKIDLETRPFSLLNLVQNIRNSLQMAADEKGIELRLRIDKNLPKAFCGDRQRLGQVLNNLISNALKFTTNGFVEIEVKYYPTDVRRNLEISVRDSGIGIAPEKQEGIFDFFSQADSSISRKFGGSGLGLTITKNLLHLMDSTIQLESHENKGSRFYFSVMLPTTLEAPDEEEILTNKADTGAELRGEILFVEDVEINRIVAERFFRKWGLSYKSAESGFKAIEMARNNRFDLILMDLQLPDMDGFKTSEVIRKLNEHTETPILAMTASSYSEIKDRLTQSGIDGFIPKPFVAAELRNILTRWLSAKPIKL